MELKMVAEWKRYTPIILLGLLVLSGLVVATVAASPVPGFYNGTVQYWLRSDSGALIGYDVMVHIVNNGDPGNVFYKFYKTTIVGNFTFASKVFWMNTGERVDATTHFSTDPSPYNGVIFVRPAEPGDSDFGDMTLLRLDAPESVSITSLNDGEELYSGHAYKISWQYTGEPGSTIRIELLKGTTTSLITQSEDIGHGGLGYYYWRIPTNQSPGSDYKIRLTTSSGYTDTSNASFTINKPSITVTSPNGGEILERGKVIPITWNYYDDPRFDSSSYVSIDLYNNGIWLFKIKYALIGSGGSGSYSWKIASYVNPGTNYTVRISSSGAVDDSNSAFTISNPTELTVNYPNGGEHWYNGQQYLIEWYYPDSLAGNSEAVELLKGGTVDRVIISNIHMSSGGYGFWSWEVPADVLSGSDYSIRINTSSGAKDQSDASFTIDPPFITVTAPKGGETWTPGHIYDITWSYAGIDPENVKLELLKSGIVNRIIESAWPISFNKKDWSIPSNQTPGNDYSIRITTTSGYINTSEGVFTIGVSAPVANFIGAPTSGSVPHTVKFTDLSTNEPTTWNWTFGDGNVTNATVQNPVHTYYTAGNFSVSLNVTNAGGFNTSVKSGYIDVTNATVSKIGVFRNSTHLFYLDYNGNGVWNGAAIDKQYNFGISGDIPVTGDWNADGRTEIGVFRNSTHLFYLDTNGNGAWNGALVDKQYNFGISGDIPLSGDWNSDGRTEIGVFRNSTHLFYLDYNGNGVWNGASIDKQYNFGITGDKPITGDWNADGKSEIGVFRHLTHLFYLDYNGNGVWNGASIDKQYNFGISGDIPVTGDWNADGRTDIGVFRPSTHLFYMDYNGNGAWNGAAVDRSYNFGITGDIPISGKW